MIAENVAFVGAVTWRFPMLLPVFAEHLEDYGGEVLPYLYMSDMLRWLIEHDDSEWTLSRKIILYFEDTYASGSEDIRDLIGVGFVELIPNPGQKGDQLREYLNSDLRSADPWQGHI